jgi:beta-aspartyl-peptidase (threonine type)
MHSTAQQTPSSQPVRIVIHGGAGTILKQNMTSEMEKEYTDKLTEALLAGYKLLEDGRPALDAVEAAIKIMEDSPLFNAGKGAVFTHEGTNELDASIMDGKTLKAGSVAGVKHIRNPISLARIVMEKSPHVMMAGEGAEAFAKQQGIEMVPPEYFRTERRWNQLQQLLEKEKRQQDSLEQHKLNALPFDTKEEQLGTVGCVARDKMGNLAAGTSTGGMTNKRFGRIGDSPIIGAGTYANNSTCAVSATGDGEFFIRSVVAHDIAALLDYRSLPLQKAAETVIDKVGKLGGTGGVICLDSKGNIALVFNSEGMYRAYMDETDKPVVLIYK